MQSPAVKGGRGDLRRWQRTWDKDVPHGEHLLPDCPRTHSGKMWEEIRDGALGHINRDSTAFLEGVLSHECRRVCQTRRQAVLAEVCSKAAFPRVKRDKDTFLPCTAGPHLVHPCTLHCRATVCESVRGKLKLFFFFLLLLQI